MYKENLYLKSIGIFLIGVVLTTIIVYYVKKENDKQTIHEFEISANDVKDKIENRLSSYIQFSRASSAFFMSSDSISRKDWKYFVEKSRISESLKGFQGIAYAVLVSKKELAKHTKRFREELNNDYVVFPYEENEIYTPIVYIEPLIDRNLKAVGFNVSSNPFMRKALEDSRDINKVILTEKVTLVQEGTNTTQAGVVMYSPIYRKGLAINTVKERKIAINGWAAISLRINDFMDGVVGDFNLKNQNKINLQIYDGEIVSKSSQLFNSKTNLNKNNSLLDLNTLLLPIEMNGKVWTLQFNQSKVSFIDTVAFIVLVSGLVFSLLFSLLMFSLFNTISIAKKMAKELTIDVLDKNKELITTNELLKESYKELNSAKEKAEESEKRLKLIANNLVNGMIYQVECIDTDKRRFTYVNDAVFKFYGCTVEEAKENANLLYDKVHRDDIEFLIEKEKESLQKMSVFKAEVRVINPDGSFRWASYVSQPRMIDGVVFWDGIEIDITERKKVEQELRIAKENAEESNHLKTEFLNNMSHEIRTPMNGILGFSNFLNDSGLTLEKRKNFIKIIQNSGEQLLQIIDDIIEISRLGTKQIKVIECEVNLNDLMLELFSIFDIKAKENKTPLYLKNELSDRQSIILTDKTKLFKVISNLLENALKFTSKGSINFGYRLNNGELEIYIEDTGVGVEKEKHELIFERFAQAEKGLSKKVGGLGLGLSIVKENVELLGGKIRVESRKGKGAKFLVTIPYKVVFKNAELSTIEKGDQNNQTILIAEDEEVNYLYLETLIKDVLKLDCEILHAKNGQEAVEYCKANENIELVLMDLKMPVLSGYEAVEKIRKFLPNLPIIAQTAYSTIEDKEKAILMGFNDFLSKPINFDQFEMLIKEYLNLAINE
ncbi:CHASE domain-containing protein [Lutibacter citreus]|uniref:CHASE domain-containing protein n=1 Tax=Lutibacter citreus TaxID=2138210 RepID=UPI000DBE2BC8|nr:CHASE domain-containing protein [Lutibacter citreus]